MFNTTLKRDMLHWFNCCGARLLALSLSLGCCLVHRLQIIKGHKTFFTRKLFLLFFGLAHCSAVRSARCICMGVHIYKHTKISGSGTQPEEKGTLCRCIPASLGLKIFRNNYTGAVLARVALFYSGAFSLSRALYACFDVLIYAL